MRTCHAHQLSVIVGYFDLGGCTRDNVWHCVCIIGPAFERENQLRLRLACSVFAYPALPSAPSQRHPYALALIYALYLSVYAFPTPFP